tara:strand:+ start:438 stop:587 length:150 start_codon:yes stop_codon:yes gene_type:complete
LELLDLVVSDGTVLGFVMGGDSDGGDGADEEKDGGEFHFKVLIIVYIYY